MLADVAPTILELAGLPGLAGDHRPVAAHGVGWYHPPLASRRLPTVNPVLAAGQLIVSVALIFAVLLQSRGSGLGGTFGGDSAVYRSRRGIERRLWQFTIVLIVLFSLFSIAAYVLSPGLIRGRVRPPGLRPSDEAP